MSGIKKHIRILSAVLATALIVTAGGCNGRKTVTIGISSTNPPLSSSSGSGGTPEGFVVDMAREAGIRMGMQVKFKYVDFSKGADNFTKEGVNILWGNLEPNEENEKDMLFTNFYMNDSQRIAVKQSSKAKDDADLMGKRVGAVKDSAAYTAVFTDTNLAVQGGSPDPYPEPVSSFLALSQGAIDALATDEAYARNQMMQHAGQYRLFDAKMATEQYAVAVERNDSKLRDSLQKALDAMKADGTSTKLSKKWFDTDMTAG